MSASGDLPECMAPAIAAKFLGVDRHTLYQAHDRGELPWMRRLGRRYICYRDGMLRWLVDSQGAPKVLPLGTRQHPRTPRVASKRGRDGVPRTPFSRL